MSHHDLRSEFGVAYVRAVAHAAGFFTQESNRTMDGDGVDLTVFHVEPLRALMANVQAGGAP